MNVKPIAMGIVIGVALGGFLFYSPVQTVEVERVVEVEKIVEVTREVKVKELVYAERAEMTETRYTDGRVVLDSRFYGLQIDKQAQSTEASTSMETRVEREKTTVTAKPRWTVSAGFFTSPVDPLAFDYRYDWQVSVGRRVGASPFFINAFGGPRLIGLGLSAEF
jgi:hypothetical protein